MSSEITGDWMDAALLDLEARKAKIDAMIEHIRELQAPGAPAPGGGSGGVRPDAFLKMSIPDAAKKHLEAVRQKQTTREVMDALENGGLPPSKYNTVYSILRRREKQVGDIINMKGDWALKEWYKNYRPPAKDDKSGNGADKNATEQSAAESA